MSTSVFHEFKKLFDANNIHYRTWRLLKRAGLQDYNGDLIVFGDENDGPYTQFCFDENGALVSAKSANDLVTVESVEGA